MLCANWVQSGSCTYEHVCRFAHGEEELRAPSRSKASQGCVCRAVCSPGVAFLRCAWALLARNRHVREEVEGVTFNLRLSLIVGSMFALHAVGDLFLGAQILQGNSNVCKSRYLRLKVAVS